MKRFLAVVSGIAAFSLLTACVQDKSAEEPVAFKVEKESPEEAASARAAAPARETPAPAGPFKTFKVYSDANSPDNHYAPSGWMGDWGDIKIDPSEFENPHGGTTSFKITTTGKKTQGANWAGIYWQNPPNNWGGQKGGYDLTGAARLAFWARGAKGGEKIEEFRVGGIGGEYPDSDIAGIGPVVLTQEWKEYEVDLRGKDLSSISGGFMWSANIDGNPEGFTIYLDDVRYE